MLELYGTLVAKGYGHQAVTLYHAFYHRAEWKDHGKYGRTKENWADMDPTPWEELLEKGVPTDG
jgi:hypothetical protein